MKPLFGALSKSVMLGTRGIGKEADGAIYERACRRLERRVGSVEPTGIGQTVVAPELRGVVTLDRVSELVEEFHEFGGRLVGEIDGPPAATQTPPVVATSNSSTLNTPRRS